MPHKWDRLFRLHKIQGRLEETESICHLGPASSGRWQGVVDGYLCLDLVEVGTKTIIRTNLEDKDVAIDIGNNDNRGAVSFHNQQHRLHEVRHGQAHKALQEVSFHQSGSSCRALAGPGHRRISQAVMFK